MPELPEVETVKRSLAPLAIGHTITQVTVHQSSIIKNPQPEGFIQGLTGKTIVDVTRRGKFLTLWLSDDAKLVLHLRMTGQFICHNQDDEYAKHTHIIFLLDNHKELRFIDIRRFGCLWYFNRGEDDEMTGINKLGVEPLSADFSADYLHGCLEKKKTAIKQVLLDQSVIAGLGNIYVDEVLHKSGIMPTKVANLLDLAETEKIVAAAKEILAASIEHRGTTFRDYKDATGHKGDNQKYLQVYQREKLPCYTCGMPIMRMKVAGRSSFYCPNCQK